MLDAALREGISQVGEALRAPEDFALRWHRGEIHYGWAVWAALFTTSILGTLTYGMTMGVHGGGAEVLRRGLCLTAGAGVAWGASLPALLILNGLAGSRLDPSTTLLAALVTTSWGGLAMVASVPINWFFTAAIPQPWFVRLENLVVFAGVGLAMVDTFARVVRTLEPERGRAPVLWLVLVAAIGTELFTAFGLFDFSVSAGITR